MDWSRNVDDRLRICTAAALTGLRVCSGQGLDVVLDGGWLEIDDRVLRTRRKSVRTE